MSKYEEHPFLAQVRDRYNIRNEASFHDVAKHLATRMAFHSPEERWRDLQAFDEQIKKHDESANLRQKAQAHRFRSYLQNAHDTLKAVGR